MIPSADEFLGIVGGINKNEDAYRLGTIDPAYVSGNPKIVFDGETTASAKQYLYLSSYTPKANDRVLLLKVSGSYVVIDVLGARDTRTQTNLNADMLDGIHSSQLILINSNGCAPSPPTSDLNQLTTTGVYNGSALTPSPDGSTDWFYVEVIKHVNNNGYVLQRATHLTGALTVYQRRQIGGTWEGWIKTY